jgi:signal peptidase I
MPNPITVKVLQFWRTQVRPLLIVVLVLSSFRSAIADWNDVPTGSMKPTIFEGDRILINKLAYGLKVPFTTMHLLRWNTPQRGEIVVFYSPKDGTRLVKRVVGLPGDSVQMINERLFINGRPLQYALVSGQTTETLGTATHNVQFIPTIRAMRNFGPLKIPAGEYFMMGDNRDNSFDSRYFGTVKLDQIVGRASEVAMSLNYDDHFLPRWGRFFKPLD